MNHYKLVLLFGAALVAAVPLPTVAQTAYPAKPVRIVVASSAGGGADIVARMIAPKLTERLGQQVFVENRPGAGTMIGGEVVAKSPPDGYTLWLCVSTLATNPIIYKKVLYDALRDFAPVTLVVVTPHIIVVHPSVPANSVKELIALARARPGQLNFASAGHGTGPHLAMELFNSMAKVKMVHVPYKGSAPAIIDILAGHIAVLAATSLTGIPHIRSGRLRALGVTTAKRSVSVPDIPTVAEAALPGYESVQWYGLVAPAGTPQPVISRLNAEVARIAHFPDMKERFLADGAEPVGNTPEEFGRFIRSEIEKWQRVAREAGIRPE